MQNFMKTIINGVQKWTKKEIKDSTADWNQNDSTMNNYIKNRTHWKEETIVTYLNKQTINLTIPCDNYGIPEGWYYEYCDNLHIKDLKIGEEYTIIIDGIAYTETARSVENGICFGKELPYYWEEKPNVPYGIFVHISNNVPSFSAFGSGNHTFEIYQNKTIAHQIDPKYIPSLVVNISGNEEDGFIADKTSTEIYEVYKNGLEVMAKAWGEVQYNLLYCDRYEAIFIALDASEGYHYQEVFVIVNDWVEYYQEEGYGFVSEHLNHLSNLIPEPSEEDAGKYLRGDGTWSDELVTDLTTKMDKNNPVGTGSFSIGRKADTDVGVSSVAIGEGIVARRKLTYATGKYNIYNEDKYVIVTKTGVSDKLSGQDAKVTYGYDYNFDPITGKFTIVDADIIKHKEVPVGCVFVIYTNSNATGPSTGPYSTLFRREEDSTFGLVGSSTMYYQYKNATILSAGTNIKNSLHKYAHIVGNGTSDTARSNAYTLDWEGNAWYAGNVYVGSASGTNKDDGSKKLITLDEVKPIILPLFDTFHRLAHNDEIPYIEGYDFYTYYNALIQYPQVYIVSGFEELDIDTGGLIGGNDPWVIKSLNEFNITLSKVINKHKIEIYLQPNYDTLHIFIYDPEWLNDIPEIESQVFVVTQESANEYEDLAEAIYNASQAGQIVIFQRGDNIYYLEYAELEPAHYAYFYRVSTDGAIHSIIVNGSTITDSNYNPNNYIDTAIANLVDSAPETLNTLNELATAIQENDNVINTLNAAITDKADKAELEELQTQVTATSLILADAITGEKYTIQIQNGQLVSFPVEE